MITHKTEKYRGSFSWNSGIFLFSKLKTFRLFFVAIRTITNLFYFSFPGRFHSQFLITKWASVSEIFRFLNYFTLFHLFPFSIRLLP